MADLKKIVDNDEQEQEALERFIQLFDAPLNYLRENLDPVNAQHLIERYGEKSAEDVLENYITSDSARWQSFFLENEPDKFFNHMVELYEPIIKSCALQIKQKPDCSVEVYSLLSALHTNIGYPLNEAIELIEEGVKQYPDSAELHHRLGLACFHGYMGVREMAEQSKKPNLFEICVDYLDKSISEVNLALELNPDLDEEVTPQLELFEKRKNHALEILSRL